MLPMRGIYPRYPLNDRILVPYIIMSDGEIFKILPKGKIGKKRP